MRVALYSRVSTQEQALHGNSIPEQHERMTKYCEAMNWEIYDQYTDAGFSGAKLDRPELQRLIRDVKNHKVEKVVVYKLDRLSRSQKDTLHLIEDIFVANNVDFVSMNENFDTSSSFGKAMIGILAVFAQLEREQIKERMIMGREARAKRGEYHGSRFAPIGYDYIDGQIFPNEYEKGLVQQVFRYLADGLSPRTVACKMNSAGLYHKYGKWRRARIGVMLQKKLYIGYVPFKDGWTKGIHEPIVDEETFYKAQEMARKHVEDYLANNLRPGKAISYLSGRLYCKNCGQKCRVKRYVRDGREYDYYVCRSNCRGAWNRVDLDNLVFGEIRKLSSEEVIQHKPKQDDQKKTVEKKLCDLEKRISKMMDLYSLENIPLNVLQDKIQALTDQRNLLSEELERLEDEDRDQLSRKDALKLVGAFGEILDRGDLEEIRTVVATLIERIEVTKKDVDIYWSFS